MDFYEFARIPSVSVFLCLYAVTITFVFRGCFIISSKNNQVNEEIRDREVRVIDVDGAQLGIMSSAEAMKLAADKKLDLVKVAPGAKPPVCRIMDYGKYRYEMQKKAKDARKKQKTIQVKEIRLSSFIEEHDLKVKANNAMKFLKDGDKVKVSIRFRGRERGHTANGEMVMMKFAEVVSEFGSVEKKPQLEGRNMTMFLAPKNN